MARVKLETIMRKMRMSDNNAGGQKRLRWNKKPVQLGFPPPVPPPLPVGTYSCHNAWLALPIIPSRYLAYHIKHIICTTSCDIGQKPCLARTDKKFRILCLLL